MFNSSKMGLAAALASLCMWSAPAHATPMFIFLGPLGTGEWTESISPLIPGSEQAEVQLSFTLPSDSLVSARVSGLVFGALSVLTTSFNEASGVYDTNTVYNDILFGTKTFDLGTLAATSVGISPPAYWVKVTGTLSSAAPFSGGQLTLSVQAVPELGTWGLMALGLVGVAAASRRRSA